MRVRDRAEVSEAEFLRLVEREPGQWELHDGQLRNRMGDMTAEHGYSGRHLAFALHEQLPPGQYEVIPGSGQVRRSARNYYVPDVYVVPIEQLRRLLAVPKTVEVYTDPLPLIVEVWSPSTGAYDRNVKLAQYQARGDLEVWYIHPYERWLIAWRRQPDGSYTETLYTEGAVEPAFLPNVSIDLASILP